MFTSHVFAVGAEFSGGLFRNCKGMDRKITHKAAAQVVEVIGKSAQSVQNSLRIPATFKLKPLPLHRAAPQYFMHIDRKAHILRFLLAALCFTQISHIPTGNGGNCGWLSRKLSQCHHNGFFPFIYNESNSISIRMIIHNAMAEMRYRVAIPS